MDVFSLSPLMNCMMLVFSMATVLHLVSSDGVHNTHESSMTQAKKKYFDNNSDKPMMDMGTEDTNRGKKVKCKQFQTSTNCLDFPQCIFPILLK